MIPLLSPASEAAHATLRRIRAEAASKARVPANVQDWSWGVSVGDVPGIGSVLVECRKEEVERRRGLKVRQRYRFSIEGTPVSEKALYEKARAL